MTVTAEKAHATIEHSHAAITVWTMQPGSEAAIVAGHVLQGYTLGYILPFSTVVDYRINSDRSQSDPCAPAWDFPSFPRQRESSNPLKRLDTRFRGYDDARKQSESFDGSSLRKSPENLSKLLRQPSRAGPCIPGSKHPVQPGTGLILMVHRAGSKTNSPYNRTSASPACAGSEHRPDVEIQLYYAAVTAPFRLTCLMISIDRQPYLAR